MSDSYPGFAGPPEGDSLNNNLFLTKQQIARLRTVMVAKVIKVYPGNNANKPTTVDVQPMVDQVDSDGNRTAHGTIYGLVTARWHGGGNAILNDPVEGDVGTIHVADRDISSVVANDGGQSAPGSGRRHDFSDAVYVGGLWTPQPTNYVDLRGGNIKVNSKDGSITHTAGGDITHTATGNFVVTAGKQIKLGAGDGEDTVIKPADGKFVYLGGDPADGGTFNFVLTVGDVPSINVKARVS